MTRPSLRQTVATLRRCGDRARPQVTIQRRLESSSAQQQQTSSQPSPPFDTKPANTNIYKQFGRPFAKVFLGAMFVYQLLYWSWEKMRLDEVKEDRREMKDLEQQVQDYKARKTGT